jgi:hypothetical protein
MDDQDWEVSGSTAHRSLAAATGVAKWLASQKQNRGWEFAATTLADGSHRVIKRRRDRVASPA